MGEIYNYLTTPWMYLLGSAIVLLVCVFDLIVEKLRPNEGKKKVTIGDIVIYVMLSCLSWVGLFITCIVCIITTTPFFNKTLFKL